MSWYFYSGKIPRPVTVKAGLSRVMRPNTRIEILEESAEVIALLRKGELRPAGKPADAKSVADEPVTNVSVSIPKSDFAKSFAEKGRTMSRDVAPVSKSGASFTEGELTVEGAEPADQADSIVDPVDALPDEFGMRERKGKKRR